ncbi:MAG: hypothetical protein ACRC8S_20955 [Fimbriiglobus sp.]
MRRCKSKQILQNYAGGRITLRPGFLARLFGAQPTTARQPSTPLADLSDQQALLERLRSLTTSVSEGYAMSLRRIEKLLSLALVTSWKKSAAATTAKAKSSASPS